MTAQSIHKSTVTPGHFEDDQFEVHVSESPYTRRYRKVKAKHI